MSHMTVDDKNTDAFRSILEAIQYRNGGSLLQLTEDPVFRDKMPLILVQIFQMDRLDVLLIMPKSVSGKEIRSPETIKAAGKFMAGFSSDVVFHRFLKSDVFKDLDLFSFARSVLPVIYASRLHSSKKLELLWEAVYHGAQEDEFNEFAWMTIKHGLLMDHPVIISYLKSDRKLFLSYSAYASPDFDQVIDKAFQLGQTRFIYGLYEHSKTLKLHNSFARYLVERAFASANYDFLANAIPPYHLAELLRPNDPIDFGLLVKSLHEQRSSLSLLQALARKQNLYDKLYKAVILWTLDNHDLDILKTLALKPSFHQVFSETASMNEWLGVVAIEARRGEMVFMDKLLALSDDEISTERKATLILSALNSAILARHSPLVLRYYKLVSSTLGLQDLELLYERASLTGSRYFKDLVAKDLITARVKTSIREFPNSINGIIQDGLEVHQVLLKSPELSEKYSHDILQTSDRQPIAQDRELAELEAETIHMKMQQSGLPQYLKKHSHEDINGGALLEVFFRFSSNNDKSLILSSPDLRKKVLSAFFERLQQDGNLHRFAAEHLLRLYYSTKLPERIFVTEFLRFLRTHWFQFPQLHPFPEYFFNVQQLKLSSHLVTSYGTSYGLKPQQASVLASDFLMYLVEHHENIFLDLMESSDHSGHMSLSVLYKSKPWLQLCSMPSHDSDFRCTESHST